MSSFLRAGVGFLLGATLGVGLAWIGLRLFCALRRPLTGQIGDIGVLVLFFLGGMAVTAVLGLAGGILGVVIVTR